MAGQNKYGANLSCGQRQHVSIARAFIRNPKFLLLNEATSALDTVSEKKIQDSVDRLVKNRTAPIAAHRLRQFRRRPPHAEVPACAAKHQNPTCIK